MGVLDMARIRYSDLVLELNEVCREITSDLKQRLVYYRASAYKHDAAKQINERVDQLRAIFQILADDDLNEAMADHDAILDQGAQMLAAGECTISARIKILLVEMEPALGVLVRRFSQSQTIVRDDTLKIIQRHRHTLRAVVREGTRSWEMLRGL